MNGPLRVVWTRWLLAVLLLIVAACAAGTRKSGAGMGDEAFLEVRNDLVPGRSITVRAVSSSGARVLIGTLSPNQTRVLRFQQPNFAGSYRFVAELDGSGQIGSNPIALTPGDRIVWMLRNNLLRILDPYGTGGSP